MTTTRGHGDHAGENRGHRDLTKTGEAPTPSVSLGRADRLPSKNLDIGVVTPARSWRACRSAVVANQMLGRLDALRCGSDLITVPPTTANLTRWSASRSTGAGAYPNPPPAVG